jgi:hypothetical protein
MEPEPMRPGWVAAMRHTRLTGGRRKPMDSRARER